MSELSPAVILVVDDDEMLREVLEAYLTGSGYSVLLASSGEKALEITEKTPPDLILLDARLSGMNGYEVCKRLRSVETTRKIPVVMVTALDDDEDKKRAIDAGIDDFVRKPFDSIVMLHRIKVLLRSKRTLDNFQLVLKRHVSEATAAAIWQDLRELLD